MKKAEVNGAGLQNMKFAVVDMQDLSCFPDSSFDVVTSCYGYMFPKDRVLALRETHRVLKPGGILVATYWLDLRAMTLARQTLAAMLGSEPPMPERGPMSLSEPGLMESFLKDVGFRTFSTSDSAYPFELSKDEDTMFKCGTLAVQTALQKAVAEKPNGMEMAKAAFFQIID